MWDDPVLLSNRYGDAILEGAVSDGLEVVMIELLTGIVWFILHSLVNEGLWIALWCASCGLVAHVARTHGRGNTRWFFMSALLLSPAVGLLILLVLPNLRRERIEEERHQQLLQALSVGGREQQVPLIGDDQQQAWALSAGDRI